MSVVPQQICKAFGITSELKRQQSFQEPFFSFHLGIPQVETETKDKLKIANRLSGELNFFLYIKYISMYTAYICMCVCMYLCICVYIYIYIYIYQMNMLEILY